MCESVLYVCLLVISFFNHFLLSPFPVFSGLVIEEGGGAVRRRRRRRREGECNMEIDERQIKKTEIEG